MPDHEARVEKTSDLAILILGVANSGKSTFVNWVISQLERDGTTLPQEPAPVRDGLAAETSVVQEYHLQPPQGMQLYPRISLVDTPGFDHTEMSNSDVLRVVAGWLKESYKRGTGIGAVIYMHDISCEWVAPHMRIDFDILEKLCGGEAIKDGLITIVTSKWERCSPEEAHARQEEMGKKLWAEFLKQGGRVVGAPDAAAAGAIVGPIVHGLRRRGTSDGTSLQIQTELCINNVSLAQTSAGRYMGLSSPEVGSKKAGGFPHWTKLHGAGWKEGAKAGLNGLKGFRDIMLATKPKDPRKSCEKEEGGLGESGVARGKKGKVRSKLKKNPKAPATGAGGGDSDLDIGQAHTSSYDGGRLAQGGSHQIASTDVGEDVGGAVIGEENAAIMEAVFRQGLPEDGLHSPLVQPPGDDGPEESPVGRKEQEEGFEQYQSLGGEVGSGKEAGEVPDVALDVSQWDSCTVSPVQPPHEEQDEKRYRTLGARGGALHEAEEVRGEDLSGALAAKIGALSQVTRPGPCPCVSSSGASTPTSVKGGIQERGDSASATEDWHDARTTLTVHSSKSSGAVSQDSGSTHRRSKVAMAVPLEPEASAAASCSPPTSPGVNGQDRSWWEWFWRGQSVPSDESR